MENTVSLFDGRANKLANFGVTVAVDHNGNTEFVCTSTETGHTVKFPADGNLAEMVAAHNEVNTPRLQVNDDGSVILSPEQQAQIEAAAAVAPADPDALPVVQTTESDDSPSKK